MVAQTSARQRLGAVLEARRTSRIGWRCAFGLPRYSSGLGQHELDGKKNDPNWDLFLSTGRGHGFSEEAQRVSESTLDESRSSRSRKEPDVPILKARAPKEHSAFPGPRITYHKVTRISSNAPQFLPRSMVDPRIHFHKMGKIPFNVQTPSNARVSSTDIELINKLFGDAGEVGSREKAKHSNSDKGEGEHISSQCLEQVQAQRTSTYNVDCNSTAQGIAAPTQRSVRISKYLLIQPNHKRAPVRIQKAPVSSIRKIRVGNTEDFVYSLHSDDASHLVRRNGSSEDAIHETLEEKLALDRELDFVLDAFQNLQPSTFSTLDASDPSASTIGVGSPSSPSEQRITHDHVNAGYCSMPKPRRPYPNLSTMTQSRHYATATSQPPPVDPQVEAFVVGGTPRFDIAIREHLRLWQGQQNKEADRVRSASSLPGSPSNPTQNLFTQSGEDDSFTKITEYDGMDEEEHIDLRPDEGITDIFQNHLYLRRGDLVELTTSNEPVLAIFVRNLVSQCQFYTMRGEWVHREVSFVRFAVPGFAHPDDLNDILPYLPADEVAEAQLDRLQPINMNAPRDAGTKVLEKMSVFKQAADSVFRRHADRLNRAYEIIAPSNERAGRTFKRLKEIAMTVLQKDAAELTQPMMWAVHKALIEAQNVTFDSMNFRQNPVYEIMPQQSLKGIAQVRDWVRDLQENIIEDATASSKTDFASFNESRSQNPIVTFIKKAQSAIRRSRLTRPLSTEGSIGPSSVKIKLVEPYLKTYKEYNFELFSENEKLVIRYLDAWVTSRYINLRSNLSSLGPMILRATGMYDGFELTEVIGYTFLQELGVITPWENRTVYKLRSLRLPGHDTVSEETTRLRSKARESLGTFMPKDSMEFLRKDWGDLPVFCIDSAETLERDDGVSLEPVDSNPSEYWVHIHVANPSAYIAPQSPTACYAAQLTESVYFPERKYPMLDPSLASNHFSIDKDRPCLTFSARMTIEGDILEKKITPGRVHNVHYLTPHAVGRELELNASEEFETVSLLTVGGEIPAKPKDLNPRTGETLDPSHISMLRTLADLGKAARRRRVRNSGVPEFYAGDFFANIYPQIFFGKTVPRPFHVNSQHLRRFDGDPIISIERQTSGFGLIALMVGDLMILAGEIAASWCSERRIPIPYRGLIRNPEPAILPEDFKRDVIDPKMALYGQADQNDLLRYGTLMGQTATSATPLEHFALGLPAYCKVTSPLRRYIDLYTHWQIEAALRREAETGTALIGGRDESYLPLSRQTVEEYAATAIHSERKISLAKAAATRHWIVQALHRAFYFDEAALPETFEVTVTNRAMGWSTGFLNWLNVKVHLALSPISVREGGFRRGDVWETKISLVDSYYVNVQMTAVRLLERDGRKVASADNEMIGGARRS